MTVWRAAVVGWFVFLFAAFCYFAEAAGADGPPAPALPDASDVRVTIGEPATLMVWNRPIVTLRAQIDALTPQARIERVRRRITELPADARAGEVKAVPGIFGTLHGFWIEVGGRTLLALLPEDVDPDTGDTLDLLARSTVENLREALAARNAQQKLPALVRSALFAVFATAVFALIVWVLVRVRNRALERAQQNVRDRPLHVRGLNLRPYLRAIEDSAIKLTALASGLVLTYVWLTLVLDLFPYTRPWSDGLAGWLTDTLATLAAGAVEGLPGLFTVIIIFLATRLIVQAVNRFFSSIERGWLKVHWLEAETARATRRLAIVLIWIFALTVAYPYIPGSHSDAFKGISVFVGLMVSLGSAGFVNQVMSGLVVVYSRSIKPGEFVQVDETLGKVSEIGVLATKILTPTRQEVTIPNAALVGSSITNYSRHADSQFGSIIGTTVTIGYDTPWRQVHAMLLLAAERTSGVRKEPKPRILQRALADFYVEYRLLVSIDPPESQPTVLSELLGHIQDVFNEFGVQIMSPHFRDQPAEKVWVPQSGWYAAPATPPAPVPTPGASASPPQAS